MSAVRRMPRTDPKAVAALAMALLWPLFAGAGNPWGADYFPNVALTTQDGTEVRFYDDLLKGKSVAINVIYTHCKDECPLETAKLAQLQRLLGERVGRDIFIYSISIDPMRDTPKVLKAYAQTFGAGPGWLFLTGKESDIRLLTKKLGLSRRSDADSRDGHVASLMVGNEPSGQWMRNSAADNPQFLAVTIGKFLGWNDPSPTKAYAEARPLSIGQGEYLFATRCSACHTIGQGDKIGPDLLGVAKRRSRAWLDRFLAEPDRLLAEGDPVATALFDKYGKVQMPNLGLGRDEVAALREYLSAGQGAAQARSP